MSTDTNTTNTTASSTISATMKAKLAEGIKKAKAEEPGEKLIVATPRPTGRLAVFVIGAGGNGARVVPPLTQMLRTGDVLNIVDDDIVEDRNIARQHFATADIGQPKALVLANRYRRRNITPNAFVRKLERQNIAAMTEGILATTPNPSGVVFIGCVDNAAGRKAIQEAMVHVNRNILRSVAWIDVGNENRGGQVILTLKSWPLRITGSVVDEGAFNMPGIDAMPQLLVARPEEAQEESCRDRIDLQTVMVNHMAAGSAINCLSWLMLGLPFTSCGAFFSTLNTMQPIKLTDVQYPPADGPQILPEKTYASR